MWIVTAEEMRRLDRETIEAIGIPGAVLMENAGRGAVCALWRFFPDLASRKVAVLCGRGNNGGDGFVIARCLLNQQVDTDVFLLGSASDVAGDARVALEPLRHLSVPVREVGTEGGCAPGDLALRGYGLVVDALLGTGLRSDVGGAFAQTIQEINGSGVPVMAVDIPSGLSSDTGRPMGSAVKADLTVTFGMPKLGHFLYPGRDLCGSLWVVDIGIPRRVAEGQGLARRVVTPESLRGAMPRRPRDGHKGSFGHLMVIAGSVGKTGAAIMASEAALRAGAGLVTLGVPGSLNLAMEARLTEVMTLPLPETGRQSLSLEGLEDILSHLEGKTAVVLGPGISTQGTTPELARELIRRVALPMVIDADGLNALEGHLDAVREAPAHRMYTPHPGEMGRLLGRTVREVQEDRIGAALELARRTRGFVALKGAGTVLANADGDVRLVPTGSPAMASAGTGDVLSGILGGLLAQGVAPFTALCLGVYLHGWLGDRWAAESGERGLLATDLVSGIPDGLEKILQGRVQRSWPPEAGDCPFHV